MVNRANQWWVELNYGNYSWAIVIIAELPKVIRAELLKLEMNNNNKVPIVTSKCWHKVTSHEL